MQQLECVELVRLEQQATTAAELGRAMLKACSAVSDNPYANRSPRFAAPQTKGCPTTKSMAAATKMCLRDTAALETSFEKEGAALRSRSGSALRCGSAATAATAAGRVARQSRHQACATAQGSE